MIIIVNWRWGRWRNFVTCIATHVLMKQVMMKWIYGIYTWIHLNGGVWLWIIKLLVEVFSRKIIHVLDSSSRVMQENVQGMTFFWTFNFCNKNLETVFLKLTNFLLNLRHFFTKTFSIYMDFLFLTKLNGLLQ